MESTLVKIMLKHRVIEPNLDTHRIDNQLSYSTTYFQKKFLTVEPRELSNLYEFICGADNNKAECTLHMC